MSSNMGVFAVDRGIWDHEIFEGNVFSEREAWLWLVSTAAWKDCRVRSGGVMIDIKRGQLAFATRFLAAKWGWSHTSTVRFLILLKNETMIGTLATRHETIITICNYDKYAFVPASCETQSGTQDGTQTVRKRYKEEELNKDNKKKERKNTREVALSVEFQAFWEIWPYPVAKQAAAKSLRSALGRASIEEICAGVRRYIAAKPPDRQWMNPTTFLNQNRWEDQPATIGVKNGQVSGISAACDRLISIVSGDFHGSSPQEHFGGGAYEDTARILPYRRS